MIKFLIYFILQFGILAHAGINKIPGDPVMSSALAIGKTTIADTKTILELVSTTKAAISCPKMTTTQRDNISSPTTGSCIYNTSTNAVNIYTGSSWTAYISDPTIATGEILYRSSTGSLDRLSPGTSGYRLQTNGAGAGPTWTTTLPTVQRFTSGSGTYTVPAGVKAIRVLAVGGGGGGGGSANSSNNAGNGAQGGTTLFGAIAHIMGGGGGPKDAGGVAAGGTPTVNPPGIIVFSEVGGQGGGSGNTGSATTVTGGMGGASCLGGGGSGAGNVAGQAATTHGGGGGGGGTPGSAGNIYGGGGGAGGCAVFWLTTLNASYSYVIGAGSTAGTAGTSGYQGGAGGGGIITVEEFY